MTDKVCPTGQDVVAHILPIFALQYLVAVLVQFRNTAYLRIALLPIMPLIVLRAFLAIDLSCGLYERAQVNGIFITYFISVIAQVTIWSLAQQLYKRDNVRGAKSTSIPLALWNACDLLLNFRGIGWNWSQGVPIPESSVKTQSRVQFLLFAVPRAIFFALGFDAFTEAVRTFFAFEIAYLSIWLVYFALEWAYHSLAIICIVIFHQHPSQWPPLFDKPWLSTSLSEFWGRRWHQVLRYHFSLLGGIPLSYIFGRAGLVLGTFLLIGLFHDIKIRAVGRGSSSLVEVGFFVMNGVGILLERVWAKARDCRVHGAYGWIWTFSWLAIWGVPMYRICSLDLITESPMYILITSVEVLEYTEYETNILFDNCLLQLLE
ncbi:hypothetical protein V8B97DRAFT_2023805 [Scleroderma yunnanense]